MKTNLYSLSAEQIRKNIMSSKGSFVKVKWKSEPKPSANFKSSNLVKVSEGVCRAGIDYANLSSIKEAISNGERGEVQKLPFGEWKVIDGVSMFPYIIEYTKDGHTQDYIRLYPSDGNNHFIKSVYYVDGEMVDKEIFASYLTASESRKLLNPKEEDRPKCFTIKADNILGIPEEI